MANKLARVEQKGTHAAAAIRMVHVLLLCVSLYAPFSGVDIVARAFVILFPFLLMHHVYNDATCILTEVEHRLRKRASPRSTTFMHTLLQPVFTSSGRMRALLTGKTR